jgi:hypothetical protein
MQGMNLSIRVLYCSNLIPYSFIVKISRATSSVLADASSDFAGSGVNTALEMKLYSDRYKTGEKALTREEYNKLMTVITDIQDEIMIK